MTYFRAIFHYSIRYNLYISMLSSYDAKTRSLRLYTSLRENASKRRRS